jgi:hypothetical protein
MSAQHPAPARGLSLYPGDAEVISEWRNRPRMLRPASDDAEPRQDRHRPLGQVAGIDRWIPEYDTDTDSRLPEWMDGAIR